MIYYDIILQQDESLTHLCWQRSRGVCVRDVAHFVREDRHAVAHTPSPLDAYLLFKSPKVLQEGRSKIKIIHTWMNLIVYIHSGVLIYSAQFLWEIILLRAPRSRIRQFTPRPLPAWARNVSKLLSCRCIIHIYIYICITQTVVRVPS